MTLKQLNYVVTVADTGNITEAARRLYIAQPSLTASIQELEKEYGEIEKIFSIDVEVDNIKTGNEKEKINNESSDEKVFNNDIIRVFSRARLTCGFSGFRIFRAA